MIEKAEEVLRVYTDTKPPKLLTTYNLGDSLHDGPPGAFPALFQADDDDAHFRPRTTFSREPHAALGFQASRWQWAQEGGGIVLEPSEDRAGKAAFAF